METNTPDTPHIEQPDDTGASAGTADLTPRPRPTDDSTGPTFNTTRVVQASLAGLGIGALVVALVMNPSSHSDLYPGDNNSPEAAVEYISDFEFVSISPEDFDTAARATCSALSDYDIESADSAGTVWKSVQEQVNPVLDDAESFTVLGLDDVEDEQSRTQIESTARQVIFETSAMFACPAQLSRMNDSFVMH